MPTNKQPTLWILFDIFCAVTEWFKPLPDEYDATRHPFASQCMSFTEPFEQMGCGACSAFALALAHSMRLCIHKHIDFMPSPFRIFDCMRNSSCDEGGTTADAHSALREGVPDVRMSAPGYGRGCAHNNGTCRSHGLYAAPTHAFMKHHLLYQGPGVVEIYADASFEHYDGRTVYHTRAELLGSQPVGHSMAVVGWGTHPEPHWKVVNSWGEKWGDHGRGMIAMNLTHSMLATRVDDVVMGRSQTVTKLLMWAVCALAVVTAVYMHRLYKELDKASKQRFRIFAMVLAMANSVAYVHLSVYAEARRQLHPV